MMTLHCDHSMNLPCDAVTVLMVITCVLIYEISYLIRTYKLLQPNTCIFYIISASFMKMFCIQMQWCDLWN